MEEQKKAESIASTEPSVILEVLEPMKIEDGQYTLPARVEELFNVMNSASIRSSIFILNLFS